MSEIKKLPEKAKKLELPFLITTSNNIIRPLLQEDYSAMAQAIKSSLESLHSWIPWVAEPPSPSQYQEIATNFYNEAESSEAIHFAAYHNNFFLGLVSIYHLDLEKNTGVLSYWCRSDFDSPLYFVSAAQGVVQYMFDHVHLKQLTVPVVFGNFMSDLMAKELSFKLQKIDIESGNAIKIFVVNNEDFPRLTDFHYAMK